MASPYWKYKQSQNKVFNPQATTQNTQQPKAVDKYKNPKYGKIVVTIAPGKVDFKTKQKYKILNLYNIDAESAKEIVARLNDTTKPRISLKTWVDPTEPTHLLISVPEEKINEWLDSGDLNAVQSVLIKSGKYDNNEVKQLEDEIFIGFDTKNTEKINKLGAESEENSLQMWQRFLSKINDPVERKQIELYSRIFKNCTYVDENGNERSLGNILSTRNATLIRSKYPDATFVLAPGLWRSLFGRGVKRNATPIPYYAPYVNGKGNSQTFQDAQEKRGWKDVNREDIPIQARNAIRMDAEEKGDGYHWVIGYDVKDTYLLSGAKEDIFNSQEGLLDNLKGELNAKAKERFKALNPSGETIDGNDEMLKRTEKACLWAETALPASGYTVNSRYTDVSNKLADYVLEYCRVNATKKTKFLAQTNVETYAQNATQITLILTNLALDALSRFNLKYEYTKPEAKALMSIVWGIAWNLEKNSIINESIMSWIKDKAQFVKMFLKALKKIGCSIKKENTQLINTNTSEENTETPETIKNNFFEVYNRINNKTW